jgi:hypothetical protein
MRRIVRSQRQWQSMFLLPGSTPQERSGKIRPPPRASPDDWLRLEHNDGRTSTVRGDVPSSRDILSFSLPRP